LRLLHAGCTTADVCRVARKDEPALRSFAPELGDLIEQIARVIAAGADRLSLACETGLRALLPGQGFLERVNPWHRLTEIESIGCGAWLHVRRRTHDTAHMSDLHKSLPIGLHVHTHE